MNFTVSLLARSKTTRTVALVIQSWLVVLAANAQLALPLAGKKPREFSEMPAQRFIENLPPAPNLPRSTKQAVSVPAFRAARAVAAPSWLALGPFPIPNGQTFNRIDPVSGRVTAIAVHPTNPTIAYVGTAQGGLYRTLNGGTTWTQLMDNALSEPIGTVLAIGAVTIDPTDPSNVVVGTGEGNFSGDSFFGNGLYIITSADTSNPIVNGPYNLRASDGADIFTGRSIVAIAVDPANHNNVFCATSLGVGGIIPSTYSMLPPRGLYRSTNAFAGVNTTGTPVFAQINVAPSETNAIITSVVIEPGNANNLVCALFSQNGTNTGGIYRTTNALAPIPVFIQTLVLPDDINVKLAVSKTGDGVTVYAATGEGTPNGRLYRSTDGGASFGPALSKANGFASAQGFYNIAVAADPTNANIVYLGGTDSSTFLYSTDGGATFAFSITGLHVDTHAIAVAPSDPTVIYHGNDGGIWKSINSGLDWTSLNNNTFSATQFQGLALHPSDRYFSIGGTQDNGTEFLKPAASFTRVDGGDGGFSLIDQNAADTISVTIYHTYFNRTGTVIGTARVLNVPCAREGGWSFHGIYDGTVDTTVSCDGTTDTFNGIALSDSVNFYAPQALGPGNPNTWYFGTDKLYRSVDRADEAPAASQLLESGTPISAIAISPQDDNVRVVGLNDGKVFATSTGASALLQIAGAGATNGTTGTPAAGVGRIAIDPNNKDVAYLCFNGFGTPASPISHVWKTTNLTAAVVNFAPASTGLPDIPVNAIVIDPVTLSGSSSTDVYVGTDAGVYYSPDGGSSWSVYGSGFPHVAVFGLEIQSPSRIIRAATHGRGMYETSTVSTVTPTPTPTPSPSPTPGTDFSTKLRNVSTRGPVETGNDVMIAGFIIKGDSKQVVLRGLGPSLTQLGVPSAINDPTLTLNDANGSLIAYNDDYTAASSADRATLSANHLTPTDSRESAIVATLPAAPYTAILRGKTNGNGLVEVYDIVASASSELVNISTRCKVEMGDNGALIAGFILSAPPETPGTSQRIAIRAIGPSLKNFGIGNAILDPTLDIYRGSQLILSNDNWKTNSVSNQQILQSSGLAPTNDKEAAVVMDLDPGSYSAVVRGKGNTTGVGLVEVYNLSQ